MIEMNRVNLKLFGLDFIFENVLLIVRVFLHEFELFSSVRDERSLLWSDDSSLGEIGEESSEGTSTEEAWGL